MTHNSSHTSISTDLNLISVHELFEHTQDVFHLIARRSFEISEARGHANGNDREDWFLAEHELLTLVKFNISESGDQLIARADVPGFNSQEIKVSIEPHRLTISGKAEPREGHPSGKRSHPTGHALLILCVVDLPAEVDLSKAKATFNDGRLEVTMPKRAPAKSVRVEKNLKAPAAGDISAHDTKRSETAGSRPASVGDHEPMEKTRAAASGS